MNSIGYHTRKANASRCRSARSQGGFGLLELLIVVAIIGILFALYSGALTKATRLAKSTATGESMRQSNIGRMAKGDKKQSTDPQVLREKAQDRFRQIVDTGKNDAIVSQLLFVVNNDREFQAYYHTLLNPDNTDPIEFVRNGWMVALDDDGRSFELKPVHMANSQSPIGWEYLSTNPSEMATGALVIQVQYGDGHVQTMKYPDSFPATKTVAELGHAFLQ